MEITERLITIVFLAITVGIPSVWAFVKKIAPAILNQQQKASDSTLALRIQAQEAEIGFKQAQIDREQKVLDQTFKLMERMVDGVLGKIDQQTVSLRDMGERTLTQYEELLAVNKQIVENLLVLNREISSMKDAVLRNSE
jgi:hypothetical protein